MDLISPVAPKGQACVGWPGGLLRCDAEEKLVVQLCSLGHRRGQTWCPLLRAVWIPYVWLILAILVPMSNTRTGCRASESEEHISSLPVVFRTLLCSYTSCIRKVQVESVATSWLLWFSFSGLGAVTWSCTSLCLCHIYTRNCHANESSMLGYSDSHLEREVEIKFLLKSFQL